MKNNIKKVLIVDDDEAILEAIQIAIEGEGYSVETLTDGEEALDKAKKYKPNVILLDLLLSGRDGSEIVKEFKTNNGVKDIPIVMISAHPSAKKSALDSGADHFLAKPFDLDELFKVLGKYSKN